MKTIDNRYAPQDYGLSLVELMRNYDLVDFQGSWYILASRATPRTIETAWLPEISGRIGDWFDVAPPNGALVVASIHMHQTLVGWLITLLYKEAHLTMELRQANGRTSQYRFVPDLAEDGFVLLPPNSLEPQLFGNRQSASATPNRAVASIRLQADELAAYAFAPTFKRRLPANKHSKARPKRH